MLSAPLTVRELEALRELEADRQDGIPHPVKAKLASLGLVDSVERPKVTERARRLLSEPR